MSSPSNPPNAKLKVFVSYSRKDMDFVDKLDAALKGHGIEPMIDRSEIYAFEDWWKRIQALIRAADTIVFVLSPHSLASDVCQKEIDFAVSLNKRFAPIVCQPVENAHVPKVLSQLNFIFFDNDARFDNNVGRLTEALKTNIEWIREHTRLGELALRWELLQRPANELLRGKALEDAEHWRSSPPEGAPALTNVQREFILESRRAAVRRQRYWVAGSLAVAAVSIVLAVIARINETIAVSEELSTSANGQILRDPELSILLATEAMKASPTVEAENALRRSLQNSHLRSVWGGHKGDVKVAYTPRGKLITAGADGTVRRWDQNPRAAAATSTLLGQQDGEIGHFSLDLSGNLVVTAGCDHGKAGDRVKILVREIETDRNAELSVVRKDDGWPSCLPVAFSPDGASVLFGASDGGVHLWDWSGQGAVRDFAGKHEGNVNAVAFSADGKLAASGGSGDFRRRGSGTARVWNVETGTELEVLSGHTAELTEVAFSPNGQFLVTACGLPGGNFDGRAFVWNVNTWSKIELPGVDRIYSVSISPDSQLVATAHGDGIARLWTVNGQKRTELRGHTNWVNRTAFSPDSKLLVTTGSYDETALVWKLSRPDQTPFAILRGHDGFIVDVTFYPSDTDGRWMVTTGGRDSTVRHWEIDTGQVLKPVPDYAMPIQFRRLSHDNRHKLSIEGLNIMVRDVATEAVVATLSGHTNTIYSAVFSSDDQFIVSGANDATARVWDWQMQKQLASLGPHDHGALTASFSHDGRFVVVACGDENLAYLWDWRTSSQHPSLILAGQKSSVRSAEFSGDDKFVVSSSAGGVAQVWDIRTGETLAEIVDETPLVGASFGPEDRSIITVNSPNSAKSHQFLCDACSATTELRALARARVTRGLTAGEVSKFLHKGSASWLNLLATVRQWLGIG